MQLYLGLGGLLFVTVCVAVVSGEIQAETEETQEAIISNSEDRITYSIPLRIKREAIADLEKASLTQEDRKEILKWHNHYRSIVNPSATDMKFMTWDPVLEGMGQTWSAGCKWEHGQPEYEGRPDGSIGQNLWAGTGGKYNLEGAINSWDKEKADYAYDTRACSKVCGHYTQVAWAKSDKVGCGLRRCQDGLGSAVFGGKAAYYLVCNYLPPGNYKGQFPFEKGTSCSNCPEGWKNCENYLCEQDKKCDGLTCADEGSPDPDNYCLCNCSGDQEGAYCDGQPVAEGAYNTKMEAQESGNNTATSSTSSPESTHTPNVAKISEPPTDDTIPVVLSVSNTTLNISTASLTGFDWRLWGLNMVICFVML